VWNVLSEKLITKIESIQRRATKMVFEIRSLSYEGRLNALGLTTLELRRKRMDLTLLPSEVVRSDTVDIFKKRVDEPMRSPNWRRSIYRI
jgi:hypothetical protein